MLPAIDGEKLLDEASVTSVCGLFDEDERERLRNRNGDKVLAAAAALRVARADAPSRLGPASGIMVPSRARIGKSTGARWRARTRCHA